MTRAALCQAAALAVLSEHAAGRSVDPMRLDWALRFVCANFDALQNRSRA